MASKSTNRASEDTLDEKANHIKNILITSQKLSKVRECLDSLTPADRQKVVNRKTNDVTTLLSSAVVKCPDIVKYMLEECGGDASVSSHLDFERDLYDFVTPLCHAAFASNLESVKILLDHSAEINWKNDTGWSALTFACSRNANADVVKYLIQHGADVFIKDSKNKNLLCFSDCTEINQVLIEQKLDINNVDVKGKTALYYAVKRRSSWTVKYFVSCGANVSHKAGNNLNVLLLAALECQEDLVQFFLKLGIFPLKEEIQAYNLLGVAFALEGNRENKADTCWKNALKIANAVGISVMEERHDMTNLPFPFNRAESIAGDEHFKQIKQAGIVAINVLGHVHDQTLRVLKRCADELLNYGIKISHLSLPIYEYVYRMYAKNLPKYALHKRSLTVLIPLMSFLFLLRSGLVHSIPSDSTGWCVAMTSLSLERINSLMELIVSYLLHANTIIRSLLTASRKRLVAIAYVQLPCAVLDLCVLHCEAKARVGTGLSEDNKASVENTESGHLSAEMLKYKKDINTFEDQVRRVIQGDVRDEYGEGPLHWAIDKKLTKCCYKRDSNIPTLALLELYMRCGADVNLHSDQQRGFTPLASLLSLQTRQPLAEDGVYKAVVGRLLAEGAHIDICNAEGELLLDRMRGLGYDILPLQYISLQCLAAKTITRFNIPYHNVFPKFISRFIEQHSHSV